MFFSYLFLKVQTDVTL